MADDLRYGDRGLLRRRLELRASTGGVRGLLDAVSGTATGDPAGWSVPESTTVRDVPLARDGPDPLHRRPAGDDPSARVAVIAGRAAALPPRSGRYRQHRALVPDGAARDVPDAAGSQ